MCAKIPSRRINKKAHVQSLFAMAYYKVGRRDQGAQLLRGLRKEFGDSLAYQYAQLYAQWGAAAVPGVAGDCHAAQGPGLSELRTDPLLDPIRDTPRGWLPWSETILRNSAPKC
jgi:hypothetical protein